jgi:hypothetical protein
VQRIDQKAHVLSSGSHVKVRSGALVYVELVRSGRYQLSHYPSSFPWDAARVSPSDVLAEQRACPLKAPATEPLKIAVFRASRLGSATITAELDSRWRHVAAGPHAYRAVVAVVR